MRAQDDGCDGPISPEMIGMVAKSRRFAMRFDFAPVATLFALLIAVAALSSAQSKFLLDLVPSQDALRQGIPVWKSETPVFFIIHMTNDSDQTLHFAVTDPAVNYRWVVLDANNTPVPETKAFRELHELIRRGLWTTGRNMLVELKPHQSFDDGIELSYYFDLSQCGTYVVQIERDSPQEIGAGVIASSPVKITVQK